MSMTSNDYGMNGAEWARVTSIDLVPLGKFMSERC